MVSAGAVTGVDYILGVHLGFQAKKTGQLICSTGKFLATTKYDVTYTGVPAHAAAAPQEGKTLCWPPLPPPLIFTPSPATGRGRPG